MTPNSLNARDIASLVHQQTDLDRHSREGAVLIDRGEGCRVWDTEEREYIEGARFGRGLDRVWAGMQGLAALAAE